MPLQRTALYAEHLRLGAKMTDFHGWEMPLYYQSILEEHASVREQMGVFDISHMGQALVSGPDALQTLNELFVSDIAKVAQGRACYTMLLNERGAILDDIIVYRVEDQEYLVIVNCGNRDKDTRWLQSHARGRVEARDISEGRSILAVQGPRSASALDSLLETKVSGLGRFSLLPLRQLGRNAWVARTGYTGSDGFELFLEDAPAQRIWAALLGQEQRWLARPVGLGARDTLRLEAGLRLYGTDMDETTSPLEADLGWTVAMGKASFMGKDALAQQKARGPARRLIGFVLGEGPVPRHGCELFAEARRIGVVTSGTFSPMLTKPIGMGYVEIAHSAPGSAITVVIRGKHHPAAVVRMPFWRPDLGSSPAVS
ncbi:MAG: glycine cleavage system aminomethyltransferase GcvT, partial [Candidatus Omnitrophica bacterium]|nr:glycine cleavage system aminomethyltransferase GcvT [Candidatus Omnitrophota bacterium]